jgi:hypothetical protein
MKDMKCTCAALYVGALLVLLAFWLPAVRSDSPGGIAADTKDLESVVATSTNSGPGLPGLPCTYTYNSSGFCVPSGNTCTNLGQWGQTQPVGCEGPLDSWCTGSASEYAYSQTTDVCCPVTTYGCRAIWSPNPPSDGSLAGCNTDVGPAGQNWGGTSNECTGPGSKLSEGG